MSKGDNHADHEQPPARVKHVFDQPATLREPAAPLVPRVVPPSSVSVIPLPNEEQARAGEARPASPQEARELTDALLREILEEEPASNPEPALRTPRAPSSKEEDWPAELHTLHLPEEH